MKRILIIGNAGSGKTTFALELAEKTGLPLVHLDKLYWKGFWEHATKDEFDVALQKELDKAEWIIDGNFNRTIPHRLKYCDTVFCFDFSIITCIAGITKRTIRSYGKTRSDMGGECNEYFDRQKLSLYRNVILFNKQHREEYKQLLESTDGVEIIVFKSRRQVKKFLSSI